MKLCSISAHDSTFVASSENLCGTSNCVFSDWSIGTYFRIENGEPKAHFVIRDKIFGEKVLFETNDYRELSKWIDKHSDEIQKQIDTKKEKWINSYNQRREYK
jgi:hypothetical protein